MSLDKAIEHGHEHRKPYTKAKKFDRTCRNHGSCNWCRDDRTYKFRKREMAEDDIAYGHCKHMNNRKSKRHFDDIADGLEDGRE
jgi:hypothetical protein